MQEMGDHSRETSLIGETGGEVDLSRRNAVCIVTSWQGGYVE